MDKSFFYLVRHGESLGNIGMSKDPNSPLSPRGRVQAGLCGTYLRAEIVGSAGIISSPFLRAVQTAEFIAKRFGGKFSLEPLLHEFYIEDIFPSKYKTESLREIAASNENIIGNYDDGRCLPDNFETREMLNLRMLILRNSLMKALESGGNDTKNLILVSHWAPIEAIVRTMCSAELTQIDNCSVTKICCDNGNFFLEYPARSDFLSPIIS